MASRHVKGAVWSLVGSQKQQAMVGPSVRKRGKTPCKNHCSGTKNGLGGWGIFYGADGESRLVHKSARQAKRRASFEEVKMHGLRRLATLEQRKGLMKKDHITLTHPEKEPKSTGRSGEEITGGPRGGGKESRDDRGKVIVQSETHKKSNYLGCDSRKSQQQKLFNREMKGKSGKRDKLLRALGMRPELVPSTF